MIRQTVSGDVYKTAAWAATALHFFYSESTARGSKSDDVVYGADDATIRTSAQVAYLNVPHWLRNSSKQICLNVGEEEYQPCEFDRVGDEKSW